MAKTWSNANFIRAQTLSSASFFVPLRRLAKEKSSRSRPRYKKGIRGTDPTEATMRDGRSTRTHNDWHKHKDFCAAVADYDMSDD